MCPEAYTESFNNHKEKKKIQIVILCCSSQKADFPVSTLILHSLDNKFIPVYTSVVTCISKQNSD